MVCIYCSGPTNVTNSRTQKRLNQVWRRRHCTQCDNVFTTHESPEYAAGGFVFKTTHGTLKPVERDKLFLSVYISCSHRSTAQRDATALTNTILAQLQAIQERGIITRERVITITYEVLQHFDRAAAVHYQAYHPL